MDIPSLRSLQTAEGAAALDEAVLLVPTEATFLACFTRLSRRFAPDTARAALSMAILRRRAAAKFPRAAEMFFERVALEQATSAAVAAHRAARFPPGERVADLCCGLGGDALAMAERGPILAVDRDPLRLALTDANLVALGLRSRVELVEADALAVDPSAAKGVFADPDRRPVGRRELSLDGYAPSVAALCERFSRALLAVKVAPGAPWPELTRTGAGCEFVSLNGELKECVLWFRADAPVRRATLLPSGESLSADARAVAPTGDPGAYLIDPDPAIIRAGLVGDLASRLGAWQIDAEIAYLSAEAPCPKPWGRALRIEATMPFGAATLRDYLRARGVGRVEVSRRGSPVVPEELLRKLKLKGEEVRAVVLTRVANRPIAIVGRWESAAF